MDNPILGMIAIFGFNFAPKGWALCNGQLLSVAQNSALFSLLGVTYGGDGKTTFGLPDLRGRSPIGQGQGPGLSSRLIGSQGGTETTTLTSNNIPAHTHTLLASGATGNTSNPQNAILANSGDFDNEYTTAITNAVHMHYSAIGMAGNSSPFSIVPPYVTLNYCIALAGIFPNRG